MTRSAIIRSAPWAEQLVTFASFAHELDAYELGLPASAGNIACLPGPASRLQLRAR